MKKPDVKDGETYLAHKPQHPRTRPQRTLVRIYKTCEHPLPGWWATDLLTNAVTHIKHGSMLIITLAEAEASGEPIPGREPEGCVRARANALENTRKGDPRDDYQQYRGPGSDD